MSFLKIFFSMLCLYITSPTYAEYKIVNNFIVWVSGDGPQVSTAGYWNAYNDSIDGGISKLRCGYPLTEFVSFKDECLGSDDIIVEMDILVNTSSTATIDYAYAGITAELGAFYDQQTERIDFSDYDGIQLQYKSNNPFYFQVIDDEGTKIEDVHQYLVPAGDSLITLFWNDFKPKNTTNTRELDLTKMVKFNFKAHSEFSLGKSTLKISLINLIKITELASSSTISSSSIEQSSSSTISSSINQSSSSTTSSSSLSFTKNHGIYPENISSSDFDNLYSFWISTYFEYNIDSTQARIKWDDPSKSVSQGTAYGLLNTLFSNDRNKFDLICNYSRQAINTNGLMSWKSDGFNGISSDQGSNGSDSEADITTALAYTLAYWKWNDPKYLGFAMKLIESIRLNLFKNDYPLCFSDQYCTIYKPASFNPAAFRVFSLIDSTHQVFWDDKIDKNYAILLESQKSNVYKLFPNWTDEFGIPNNTINPGISYDYNKYALEAIWVPYKLTLDYIWFNEPRAKDMMINFLAPTYLNIGGDIYKTGQKYRLSNGEPVVAETSAAYAGSFCLSAMVDSTRQQFLNDCYPKVLGMSNNYDVYYTTLLQVVFTQLMSNKYQNPIELMDITPNKPSLAKTYPNFWVIDKVIHFSEENNISKIDIFDAIGNLIQSKSIKHSNFIDLHSLHSRNLILRTTLRNGQIYTQKLTLK